MVDERQARLRRVIGGTVIAVALVGIGGYFVATRGGDDDGDPDGAVVEVATDADASPPATTQPPASSAGGGPELLYPLDGMLVIDPSFVVFGPPYDEVDTFRYLVDDVELDRSPGWYDTWSLDFAEVPDGPHTLTVESLARDGSLINRVDVQVRLERFAPGLGLGELSKRYEAGEVTADELLMAGSYLVHEPHPDADPEHDSVTGDVLALTMFLVPEVGPDTKRAFDVLSTSGGYTEPEVWDEWEARQPPAKR